MKLPVIIKTVTLLLSIQQLLAACNNNSGTMNGGPCSYKETIIPAVVTQIEEKDSGNYDIVFVLQDGQQVYESYDTIQYYFEKHNYLTKEDLNRYDIKIGDSYKYIVSDMISGSCNPHIKRLVMEKFK